MSSALNVSDGRIAALTAECLEANGARPLVNTVTIERVMPEDIPSTISVDDPRFSANDPPPVGGQRYSWIKISPPLNVCRFNNLVNACATTTSIMRKYKITFTGFYAANISFNQDLPPPSSLAEQDIAHIPVEQLADVADYMEIGRIFQANLFNLYGRYKNIDNMIKSIQRDSGEILQTAGPLMQELVYANGLKTVHEFERRVARFERSTKELLGSFA